MGWETRSHKDLYEHFWTHAFLGRTKKHLFRDLFWTFNFGLKMTFLIKLHILHKAKKSNSALVLRFSSRISL